MMVVHGAQVDSLDNNMIKRRNKKLRFSFAISNIILIFAVLTQVVDLF